MEEFISDMAAPVSSSPHWSGTGKLRGGRPGIWFFITALRVPATMNFHCRVFGPQRWWKRRWLVFKHFLSFGQALVDRTAILAGDRKHFSFSFEGENHVRDALAEGRGVLLLTAHVGNWEAAGALLSRLDSPVNVTGFDNESTEVRTLLNQASRAKFRLLPLTGAPTDVIHW
jgi:predicted LPLAT superfamily acyltransferase